ncbi:MAG: S49 family peptidase, partial [Chitinophagaceae bacterium]
MKNFFKIFFASLLALIAFCFLAIFVLAGALSAFSKKTKDDLGHQAVLVIDLAEPFLEIGTDNPLSGLGSEEYDLPSLHDVLRLIRHASTDTAVKGIYLKCGANGNGLGNSEEIREALRQFKKSGKFVYAFADVISQSGYVVANIADKIYCHPKGGVDWKGYVITYFFVKGTLEKLGIEPQIFYAGKFKSATEPFRETHMTEPNRIQSSMILTDLYNHFLKQTAEMRGVDTGTLHRYATEHAIRTAADALRYRLIDGLTYEDEFNGKIRERLGLGEPDKINFVSIRKYAQLADFKRKGKDKIAVIYAQGDIIDGKGDQQNIGSETYQQLIRKVRMDKSILAIVFRINSGGGSALASESIWRELSLARKEKPVILSFGNVAASGGYYLSCNADSIFASSTTI